MNIAIIPARGGSRRIPRKNIRTFHGKPIIAYSIEAALKSKVFDEVWVSSEDEEIGRVALKHGACWYRRPKKLAEDAIGTQEIVANLLSWIGSEYEYKSLYAACCIYATAPMLTAEDLQQGYKAWNSMSEGYLYIDGWYYWGDAHWFNKKPLTNGLQWERPEGRWLDINTEEDWQRAEIMYAELHKVAA